MLRAFALSLGQLADPRIVRVLVKSLIVTVLVFAALGAAAWWGLQYGLARYETAQDYSEVMALGIALLGGWLLWRIVALMVLQLFADEVVLAVEARHYPAAAASARQLGWHEELASGLRGAGRAVLFNLLALPVALVLLVTGVGAPLVFGLVNAVLLGRELQDMVWLRHRPTPTAPAPLSGLERVLLGAGVTALLTIPFVNLLAPVLGAASATHLVHRRSA